MCKRNTPDKNGASTGCVRETPFIEKEISRGSVWEIPEIKKRKKEAKMGCVRETPCIEINTARDVKEKLPA